MGILLVKAFGLIAVILLIGSAMLVWKIRLLHGGLIALGGVSLGLVQVWKDVEDACGKLPVAAHHACLATGVGASLLGVLGLVLSEVAPRVYGWKWLARILDSPRYRRRRADTADLPAVYELASREFNTAVSPIETIRDWHAKNSEVIWLIEAVRESAGGSKVDLVGYFCVLPLAKKAVPLVDAESLTGVNLRGEDLVKRRARPAAIYIGGVAGVTWRAEGAILAFLYETINAYCRKGEMRVYTRPTTKDGLRLARKHRLAPVNPSVRFGELNRTYAVMWDPYR